VIDAFGGRLHLRLAGAHRSATQMNRARTALADAAAELGALESHDVADHPQEGHVRGHIVARIFNPPVSGRPEGLHYLPGERQA